MNWSNLEAARRELSQRAGRRINQQQFAGLIDTPVSTMNAWRPAGKVGAVPNDVAAHITTLLHLPPANLIRRLAHNTAPSTRQSSQLP